jgi:hypothetical protein
MYADISRDTHLGIKHLTRVLMQQGRVFLDADWNEQTSILLRYLQALGKDLMGPYAGTEDGFKVSIAKAGGNLKLTIGPGHYYVDGILCENEGIKDAGGVTTEIDYYSQPDYPLPNKQNADKLPDPPFLVYLDTWERGITYLEDDTIREVALEGPDTAARTQQIWQVKVSASVVTGANPIFSPDDAPEVVHQNWDKSVNLWQPQNRGLLKAKSREDTSKSLDPCIISPDARYRGLENHLYRVEVHTGGSLANGDMPTFKWSRDNGSVVFPIRRLNGNVAEFDSLGWDSRNGLKEDEWVEILDDDVVLRGTKGFLAQVNTINRDNLTVTFKFADEANKITTYSQNSPKHPLVRRWDYKAGDKNRGGLKLEADGAAAIVESNDATKGWLTLEDGVQVQFQTGATYRSGDYWLIPARVATGDVEWPGNPGNPLPLAPNGVIHHYAPLAIVTSPAGGGDPVVKPLRRILNTLWTAAV